MKATVRWTGDRRFTSETQYVEESHTFSMDAPVKFGGKNSAPSPMEVLLASAGTCAAMDVISILTQSGQAVKDCSEDIGLHTGGSHIRAGNKAVCIIQN